MWNHSISLPLHKTENVNANGIAMDPVYEFLGGIPANFTDVTRNDEMLGAQGGYVAEQNVEIAVCNYSGQSFLLDEGTGKRYEVVRTHRNDRAMTMIMTCGHWTAGKT